MLGHYLMFNRNCEEALKIYEKAFDTKVVIMQKYRDMPADPNFPIPDSDFDLVLHSRLVIEGTEIMCADSSKNLASGNNMYITLTSSNAALMKQAWAILQDEGMIYLELNPTFFAKYHGYLQDKFGVNWMFTVE